MFSAVRPMERLFGRPHFIPSPSPFVGLTQLNGHCPHFPYVTMPLKISLYLSSIASRVYAAHLLMLIVNERPRCIRSVSLPLELTGVIHCLNVERGRRDRNVNEPL